MKMRSAGRYKSRNKSMSIQWFPGHMNKALKEIEESLKKTDIIIEMTDARLPYSSCNPYIDTIREVKPTIKILNKADLADPSITEMWINHYEMETGIKPLAISAETASNVNQIPSLCKTIIKTSKLKNVRAMVVGIPNIGKSTLINTIAGRKVNKVGNVPAITRHQQRFGLKGLDISDTPGILWADIDDELKGLKLAASGAISNSVFDFQDVAFHTGNYLLKNYESLLTKRFKLKSIPKDGTELLEAIGRKRGCLKKGGVLDYYKASDILLFELRTGLIGRISFETPDDIPDDISDDIPDETE